jgi:hypothetical protein
MVDNTGYSNESLAMRYVTLTGSSDMKIKVTAYKKLLDLVKSLGWAM